jgi:hypothetical protein
MLEHPDVDPRTTSEGDDGGLGWDGRPIWATAAEKAFAASLAELDRADREAGLLDDFDTAGPAPWDEAVVSDDELVTSLGRSVHEADLMLLASIDPRDLSENLVRVGLPAGGGPHRRAGRVAAVCRGGRDGRGQVERGLPARGGPWSTRSRWRVARRGMRRGRRSRSPARSRRRSPGSRRRCAPGRSATCTARSWSRRPASSPTRRSSRRSSAGSCPRPDGCRG